MASFQEAIPPDHNMFMPSIVEQLAQGLAHHQAGRAEIAEQLYRQILQTDPDHADALHLLGVLAYQHGKYPQAFELVERAIRANPAVAAYYSNRGLICQALSQPLEAEASYRKALQLQPDHAEALNNLGFGLREQGRTDEAIVCWRKALTLQPALSEVAQNLGNSLKEGGQLDEAVACYRRALELKPANAEALRGLANTLRTQGKLDEAVACFRRTLELRPNVAETFSELAQVLAAQGKNHEAIACNRRALELNSGLVEAHNNLGTSLKELGQLDEAVSCYGEALRLSPEYAEVHLNLALMQLLSGDFDRGWQTYEWRWRTRHKQFVDRGFRQPMWNGEPFSGQAILLHAEQGLGDTIQFVRYAPLVKARGGRVIVECQSELVSLLSGASGIDAVVAKGEPLPLFDVRAPLLSLPRIFRTTLETIPAKRAYLRADAERIENWRLELERYPEFKIGVVWQGNPAGSGDRHRSFSAAQLIPLAKMAGVRLFSLQKGRGNEQFREVNGSVDGIDLSARIHDFQDTAAIMANLDLVITCDTAPAHLAGALGMPVWIVVASVPDWRWQLGREDSPWYPSARLFRQRTPGDWSEVFERIKRALETLLEQRSPRA